MSSIRNATIVYYLLGALYSVGVGATAATYALYLLESGLDKFQVNLINMCFFVTVFVCELPTGAFADVYGRKKSFIVSCFLITTGLTVYALSEGVTGFILAEVIVGIAVTFASGAFQSWYVDEVRNRGFTGPIEGPLARSGQINRIVTAIAASLGAFLSEYSGMLPWLLGAGATFMTGLLAVVLMKEKPVTKETGFGFAAGIKEAKSCIGQAAGLAVSVKEIRFLMLAVLFLSFAVMAPNMQWQPLFLGLGVSKTGLGLYVQNGIAISMVVGAGLAPRLIALVGYSAAFRMQLAVTGVGIAATVVTESLVVALVAFMVHEVARGAVNPTRDAYLHNRVDSRVRATMLSVNSMVFKLGGLAGLFVSGWLAEYVSLPVAWIVSGVVLLVAAVYLRSK